MSLTVPRRPTPVERQPVATGAPSPLRQRGGVLLVACYELGHQPLSLAAPMAHLRQAGFDPVAVDTAVEPLADAAIRQARLIAIAVPMHTALRLGARVAARAKRLNPDAHVSFFGLYATLNADYLLGDDGNLGDSVISGEIEPSLVGLAEALERGDPPETVAGVGTRTAPAAPIVPRTTTITLVPDRTGLPPLRSYAGFERNGVVVPAGYVEATRGCHHQCKHCPITPIYGGHFVVVPREIVLADARAQIEAGARHITFGDPDFFNGPGHSMRIVRALHEEFPWLTFDATIKVEHLIEHQRLLPELAASGCAFVVTAVESLNPTVLAKLAKGHTRAQVTTALRLLDAVGIVMRPSLLPFSPWETLDSYIELLTWLAEEDMMSNVDPIQLAIRLLVPPGSALLDDPDNAAIFTDLDAEAFTYRWSHPDPAMDELYRQVSAIVEEADRAGEDPSVTFLRIWDAAHNLAGRPGTRPPAPKQRRGRSPRLTENWFC